MLKYPKTIRGCVILLAVGVFLPASASDGDNVSYKFQYYDDANNCQVISNTVHVTKKLNHSFSITTGFLVDAITAASRKDTRGGTAFTDAVTSASTSTPSTGTSGSPATDALTGASITDERRNEYNFTLMFTHDFIKPFRADKNSDDPAMLSLTYMDSREADYVSQTISAGASQDLFDRNTTIGVRYNISMDQYSPAARFVPKDNASWNYLGDGRRRTTNYSASLTQGLTQTTVASLVLGYGTDQGYLDRPYNVVRIGTQGVFYHEHFPSNKESGTLVFKLNQFLPVLQGSSLQTDYRYYQDSWDIQSHTIGLQYYLRFIENFTIRPNYRFYYQTAAFFYQPQYMQPQPFMTVDLKHSQFSANTLGIKLIYELKDFMKPADSPFWALYPVSLDLGVDYYTRSGPEDIFIRYLHYDYGKEDDGFQAYWIQSGITFAF